MASRCQQSDLDMNTHFARLIDEINSKFDTLIQSLADRKLALVREVESLQIEKETKEKKRIKSIQELEMVIRESKSLELENNVAMQKRDDFLKEIELELGQLKLNIRTTKLELELDIATLQDTISNLGHLKPVTPISIPTPVDYTKKITPVSIPTPVDYTKKITPVKSVGMRGKGPCEFDNPYYIAIDDTSSRVYVSDCGNSRVQVLSLELEFITEFGKQDLKRPTGIAIYGDFIFVSDNELNEILKYELPDLKLVSRNGKTEKEKLMGPRGLTSDANGDIYVVEYNRNRVSIFNKNLKFNKHLGEKQLRKPLDIRLSQDKVYVVDQSTHNIHIYNKSGVKLCNIIKLAGGTGFLSMCIDRMGNIIVSDGIACSIQIYTQAGDLIHSISYKGDAPLGVAVTSNQSIVCAFSQTINFY